MRASRAIKVSIERPYAEVYNFIADVQNLEKWALPPGSHIQPMGGDSWLLTWPDMQRVLHTTPHNPFGVLDYESHALGETNSNMTAARLVANGEGCELVVVYFQRAGISLEQYESDAEWFATDLLRLKTLLETS